MTTTYTNPRVSCPYCDKSMLTRSFGKHIYQTHLEDMFSSSTPAGLKNRVNLTVFHTPLETHLKAMNDTWFWCLGCQACLKRKEMTKKHMNNAECKQKHQETITKLRDQYPKHKEQDTPLTSADVDDKTKKRLELFVLSLYDIIHKYHAIIHAHKSKIAWGDVEERVFGFDGDLFEKVFDPNDDFDYEIENLSTFINFDEQSLRAKTKDHFLSEFYARFRDYKDTLEDQETKPEPQAKKFIEGLREIMNSTEYDLKERREIIASALKRTKHSDPVLEAFCKQENTVVMPAPAPAPAPAEPKPATLFGSKRRPKSEDTPVEEP